MDSEFNGLREAAVLTSAQIKLEFPDPISAQMPDFVALRELAQIYNLRAIAELHLGMVNDAFAEYSDVNEYTLGLNYYSPTAVRHWTRERPKETADGHGDAAASPWIAAEDIEFPRPAGPTTAMGWGVDPRGLTELLLRLARECPGLELMVTENGAAFPDVVADDGRIADPDRIVYLQDHLAAVQAAIAEGAPVTGYYVWSLLDNFEWAWGYEKRFGIVHVDFATQARTPKDSAAFYTEVIGRNIVRC
jgi:beta-glucosidase